MRAITWTPELAAAVADLANDAEQSADARTRAREIAWNAYAGMALDAHHVGFVSALRQRLTGHGAQVFEAAWAVAYAGNREEAEPRSRHALPGVTRRP